MNENDTSTSTGPEDDLRELFAEATSDVRPAGTFEEILERTRTEDSTARRWFLPAVAAAVVIGLAVGGVGWSLRDRNGGSGSSGPSHTSVQAPTSASSEVYYLGDTASGPRLFAESTVVHNGADDAGHATENGARIGFAMDAAQLAVAGHAVDPDYRSAWPSGTTIQGLGGCVDPGCEIQVTFAGTGMVERPAGMSEEVARLSLEQLVRSVQAALGARNPVFFAAFTQADDKTEVLDHVLGVDTRGPQQPQPDDAVMAPVQITTPVDGADVPAGDLTVTGRAAAFEGTVQWELLVGGDTVVKQGHATAAECCTLSPYSFTIHGLQPGGYTLVVHDTDESGTGRPTNQDTKEIIVK
ncbi:MAG: Gmad2 immunoglobulin-like domain-containing protein [Marmoricola sp.]